MNQYVQRRESACVSLPGTWEQGVGDVLLPKNTLHSTALRLVISIVVSFLFAFPRWPARSLHGEPFKTGEFLKHHLLPSVRVSASQLLLSNNNDMVRIV